MIARSYLAYFRKTIQWFAGNLLFGLSPLIFMLSMWELSDHKLGGDQISDLIHEGVILFVLCAIMGSIMLDFALGGHLFNGYQVFTIFIIPLLLLAVICLNYLLISQTILNDDRFDIASFTTTSSACISISYCLFQKTNLYLREDRKRFKIPGI